MRASIRSLGMLFSVLLGPLAKAEISESQNAICFVNGADGMSGSFFSEIPRRLKAEHGIDFYPIDIGSKGDVQTRASRFVQRFRNLKALHPNLKCHLFAYSMGGIVSRYIFAKVPGDWAKTFLTFTTFASPHAGTPIADLISEFFPDMQGRGLETLSERAIADVSHPKSPNYWQPPSIPTYSYRSYLGHRDDAASFVHKVVYEFIVKDSEQRKIDARNDGMVPLRSQGFGLILADFRVPHSYFGYDTYLLPFYPQTLIELFKTHWDCLETGRSEVLKSFESSGYFESTPAMNTFCH